jgi:predicted methyltransferase
MARFALVEEAHRRVGERLSAGAVAIDATVGNGHDTLFLAQTVVPSGRVFGFDIQKEALQIAEARLQQANCLAQCTLLHASHGLLASKIPVQYRLKVQAVMFNLGYLPGGDKSIITSASETVAALTASAMLLAPGGLLTVLAYQGHAGGDLETKSVEKWCRQLDAVNFMVDSCTGSVSASAPILFSVCKRA